MWILLLDWFRLWINLNSKLAKYFRWGVVLSKLVISVILLSLVWQSPARDNPAVATVGSQISTSDLEISLLSSDGVLVPFAEFQGGKWLNPWPKAADSSAEEPNALAGLSKPWFAQGRTPAPVWYFWSRSGALQMLNASQTVQVHSHCQTEWGLLSDLPKELSTGNRYGILGVALDKKFPIDPMVEVDRTSGEWDNLSSVIQSAFNREEEIKIAGLNSFLKPPPRAQRRGVSAKISYLYRGTTIAGKDLYYFEALKEYKKPLPSNDQSCNNIFFKGWMLGNSSPELKLLDTQIGWTDCEQKEDRIPLASLKLGKRVFVITYDLGYEGESYSIFELSESGIHLLLETAGGSC
jgi:hypothetical protein